MVQGDIRDCSGISAPLVWISVQVENIVSITKLQLYKLHYQKINVNKYTDLYVHCVFVCKNIYVFTVCMLLYFYGCED